MRTDPSNWLIPIKIVVPVVGAIVAGTALTVTRLSAIETGLRSAMTVHDMRAWEEQFQTMNPTVKVPGVDHIFWHNRPGLKGETTFGLANPTGKELNP
jgi:hypothetical protein